MTKHDLFNQPSSIHSLRFSLTKMEHAPRPTSSKNIGTKNAPRRWWNRHCQKGSPEMVQRALIVEDEPLIAIDLEATLRTLGFDVCGSASNPREAVELATSRQPDFILMDVYLDEGRQGINAAKWLREACGIPVLFITGHSDWETVARIHDLLPGAPLCAKPVRPDRLVAAIAGATGWNAPVSPPLF